MLNEALGVVEAICVGAFSGSLGQLRVLSWTPEIVRFSKLPELSEKLTALYIADCSV